MGWNEVKILKKNPLLTFNEFYKFYFVHSYYVVADKEEDIMTTTTYSHEFTSGMCVNNLFGVQFHPEKSHRFGLDLIRKYISL